MEGIPLALVAEKSPMLKLFVIGNLECIYFCSTLVIIYIVYNFLHFNVKIFF